MSIVYMTASQKVAALMVVIGAERASEVLKNIEDSSILEQITIDIASLHNISYKVLNDVVSEFYPLFCHDDDSFSGGVSYAKSVLELAYGKEKANAMTYNILSNLDFNPFENFEGIDEKQFALLLEDESEKTLAVVLANLSVDFSAKVMSNFPQPLQAKILEEISVITQPSNEELLRLSKRIEKKLLASINLSNKAKSHTGVDITVEMLSKMSPELEKSLLKSLEASNPELAQKIKSQIFEFEDMFLLDEQGLKRLLKEVDTKDLAIALKGASEDRKQIIFCNLPEKSVVSLKEEIEYSGPVRTSEVEEVQTKITAQARELQKQGELKLHK